MLPRNIRNRITLARAYLRRSEQVNAFPFELAIGITNRCNLDCETCPQKRSRRPRGNISLDLLDHLLRQAAPYVDAVDLSFDGEPFLHPAWRECIITCHRYGIKALLQTNALLVDEKLACEILDAGVDSITFSVDAASPETYAKLKPSGDYDLVVANVERFLHLTAKRAKKPYVIIQFVRSPGNAHETATFLRRWKGKGADFVRIKPMFNFAGSVGLPSARSLKKPCILPWVSMAVHWDGIVPVCCLEIEGRIAMGDASKKTLKEILADDSFRALRRIHLSGKAGEHPVCGHCDIPLVAGPFVIGAAFVGDLTRRKLINSIQQVSASWLWPLSG